MNRILIPILSLILVGGMASKATAEEPPLKVFVFAGTSNLSSGSTAELPDDLRQPQKDVLVYQEGRWVPLEAGKVPLRGDGKRFGPEVAFGQAMTKHLREPIGIITASIASSDDRAGYAKTVMTVKEAQKSRPIVIAGMLAQVGVRDAFTEERAKDFQKNLTNLIESTRRDFGNAAMPFGQSRSLPSSPRHPHLDVVRKGEVAIDLPGYRVIDCDDVPRGGDKIHYTSKGQVELGKRYAAAMIELMKVEKKEK